MIAPPKPPAHDELEALIKEARSRQLRRRLLGAAGVAIAAALGLSIYAATIGGSRRLTGAARIGQGGVPLCRSSQLSMSIFGQAATQMALGGALITNAGGEGCALPTGRAVVRITWHGRPMHVTEPVPKPGKVQSGRPAHILAPGEKLSSPCGCGTGAAFRHRAFPRSNSSSGTD